jgi:hypothetical protein
MEIFLAVLSGIGMIAGTIAAVALFFAFLDMLQDRGF